MIAERIQGGEEKGQRWKKVWQAMLPNNTEVIENG